MRPCRSISTSAEFDAQMRARFRSARPESDFSCIASICRSNSPGVHSARQPSEFWVR